MNTNVSRMDARAEERPIVIAAGGTGGHLFPGQALAQELRRRGRKIVLITDERVQRFDVLFPEADIFAVPAATPSGKGAAGLLRALPIILSGTAQAFSILGRVKPAAVIGFGGYPTLPPVLAALLRGIPTCVHEQNAVLGRVNKLVAGWVGAVASTFDQPKFLKARDMKRLVVTGNPVRDAVIAQADVDYDTPKADGPLNLLVFGGSQGARVMSDTVPGALARLPENLRARLRVTQQCRAEDLKRVGETYQKAGIQAELSNFFDDMPARIAATHLVIGRSGASTVSELSIIGRPSILVPLPHSIDNDQKANAEKLADVGAAWMIEQKFFTEEELAAKLQELFGKPSLLAHAAFAARTQGRPQAVKLLADLVERLARGEKVMRKALAHKTDDTPSQPLLFAGETI